MEVQIPFSAWPRTFIVAADSLVVIAKHDGGGFGLYVAYIVRVEERGVFRGRRWAGPPLSPATARRGKQRHGVRLSAVFVFLDIFCCREIVAPSGRARVRQCEDELRTQVLRSPQHLQIACAYLPVRAITSDALSSPAGYGSQRRGLNKNSRNFLAARSDGRGSGSFSGRVCRMAGAKHDTSSLGLRCESQATPDFSRDRRVVAEHAQPQRHGAPGK